jgi:GAF domain-containing protein/HAMP domain-containing protein
MTQSNILTPEKPAATKEQKISSVFRVAVIMLIAAFTVEAFYLFLAFQMGAWQMYALAGVIAVFCVMNIIALPVIKKGYTETGGWLMVVGMLLVFPAASALIANIGIIFGGALIMLTIVVAGQTLPGGQARIAIIAGIFVGVLAAFFDYVGLDYRLFVPEIQVFIPVITAIILLVMLGFVFFQFRNYSLQTKFLVSILASTGISVMIFGIYAVYSFQQTQDFMAAQLEIAVLSQARQQLNNVVETEAHESEIFFMGVAQEVSLLAEYQTALYANSSVLSQGAYWDANARLSQFREGHYGNSRFDPASIVVPTIVNLDEAIIADINTNVYLDFTAPSILEANPNIIALYFISTAGYTIYYPNISLGTITPPDFDPRELPFFTVATPDNNPEGQVVWTEPYQDPAGQGLLVTSVAPVYDNRGNFRGVVAADVRLIDITESISDIKVQQSDFSFLVDSQGRIIGMPEAGYEFFNLVPEVVAVEESPTQTILGLGSIELQEVTNKMTAGETGLEIFTFEDEQFIVSYTSVPSVGYSLGLIAHLTEVEAFYLETRDQVESTAQAAVQLGTIILVAVLLAAAGASLMLSQFLSRPIVRLTAVAEQVSAGNLNVSAEIQTKDEIGTLANTFNLMISQLKNLFATLEERVADRTRGLELAAEVGRSVSEVRELDVMLKDAAEIIRSRFDLYYVQVYLVDTTQTNLLLQAGTGSVGAQLLERGHRLRLDTGSINGRAAFEQRSVVITDTTASATFRPNPLLPDTRSEMAIPLLLGDRLIGVLNLQSGQPNALNEENLTAFEALAGQIAVAIQNANLFEQAEQARAEVEAQARRLVRTNWQDYLDAIHRPEQTGFIFEKNEISPLETEHTLDETPGALTASISFTGQQLGALVVDVDKENQTPQAVELVNTVARQVAQQIENLRLLESAERYRMEAEESARRLTREGWEEYFREKAGQSLSYLYDLKEVRPHEAGATTETALNVPIKVREENIGKLSVLGLDTADVDSLSLVNAVSERLAEHLESLRLLEETQQGQLELTRRAQQLAAVSEISTISSRELDIQKMLTTVVHLTQRKFGLYHAHIFTYDEANRNMQIVACGWKEGDEHQGTHGTTTIPLDQEQSLVARAARNRAPIVVNDVHNEPGWLPNPFLPDTQSELAVPLAIGDEILGVLDVQSDRLDAFSDEDVSIQVTLAAQIATALQNARSFARAQRQADREAMLNAISQKIQSATSVEAVLQIAARELGHALGAPRTIAQLSMKDK